MHCKLCTKYPENPLLDLYSTKGRELQILEIIQKHLSILEIDQNQLSYAICSDCCHVLCNFHELYLLVESSQEKATIHEVDPIDSSTPAKLLFDDFKLDCDVVKLESKCNDFTNIGSPQLDSEKTRKRRSKRLNPQNVQTASEHEFPLQLEAEFVVKDEIITATSTDADADALKVANDSDFKPHMASDTEEYDNTIDNFVETSFSKVRKKKTKTKSLLRKTKSTKSNQSISSTFDQLYKSHDEFLAKNYKFSCCLCHVSLEDFSALKKHFRLKHNISGYVICCRRKLLERRVLVDHIQTHLNPDFFKCSICDKVASDRQCLELHMQIHEKKRERTFQCETCSKRYFSRKVFLRHLKLHIPEEEKTSKCPQCEKTFPTIYSMNQHLKIIHLNAYSKICDICGKSIRGREALRLHQQEHAGVPKALVECELCGLRVKNKYGLSRHMKIVHSEENAMPQICTICSKVSPTVSSHRRHMNYMHRMERNHACPMCDKAFKRAKSLQEHMTTHTGEVLYTCPHCPKTFNSNANMHSHRKKVHRKEWEETRLQRRCHTQSDVITKNDVQHDNDDYSSIGIDLDNET